jgi:hypothetical protein
VPTDLPGVVDVGLAAPSPGALTVAGDVDQVSAVGTPLFRLFGRLRLIARRLALLALIVWILRIRTVDHWSRHRIVLEPRLASVKFEIQKQNPGRDRPHASSVVVRSVEFGEFSVAKSRKRVS